jgi:hypothetical protein
MESMSPRGRHRSLLCFQKIGKEGLMKLEEACVLEVKKRMGHGDSKEDPLAPVVRTHQHHLNSTMLQLIMVMITVVMTIKIITKKKYKRHVQAQERENKCRILAWKPEGRKLIEKLKCK